MSSIPRFHLAFPVHDLEAARHFYRTLLGCREGRSDSAWVDFDFYGHQIVAHLVSPSSASAARGKNEDKGANHVDGEDVPVPHFGLILKWDDWTALAEKAKAAGIAFVIEPQIRFKGKAGEQATMFFRDPSGNALEFKAFRDERQIFAVD